MRIHFIVHKCSLCFNANTSYLQLYRRWICWGGTTSRFVTWCSCWSCRWWISGWIYNRPLLAPRAVPAAVASGSAVPDVAVTVVPLVDSGGATPSWRPAAGRSPLSAAFRITRLRLSPQRSISSGPHNRIAWLFRPKLLLNHCCRRVMILSSSSTERKNSICCLASPHPFSLFFYLFIFYYCTVTLLLYNFDCNV